MNAIHKLTPFRNSTLSEEDQRKLFEDSSEYQKDRLLMGNAALRVSYWIGGTGVLVGVAGMICAATLFPLKTRVVEYYTVNQTTGYSGPSVGAADAPSLFNEQVAQFALREYVELRENYLFETDGVAFHRVALMSTGDEQVRYKAMHDAPASPSRVLKDKGYVQVQNFQFWLVGDGKAKTRDYVVKFDRFEMRAGQPAPLRGDPYTAHISFQFHPEYPMSSPDRRLNVYGLQVLSYRVDSDNTTARTN